MTRTARLRVPCPCPRLGGHVLKALRLGACAMFLMLVTTAMALASTTKTGPRNIVAAVLTVKRDRQALHFFVHHRWLLTDPRFSAEAKRQITAHRRSLRVAEHLLASRRRQGEQRWLARRLAATHAETPGATICRVFGSDCNDAVRVAQCESGLQTTARNGQYLGLFQMGTLARQLFGHGDSAEEQAHAALRYFVASGRDWRPWSCRPR